MRISVDLSCFSNGDDDLYRLFNGYRQFAQKELFITLEPDSYHKLRELFRYLPKENILFYSTDEEKYDKIAKCESNTHFDTDANFLDKLCIQTYLLTEHY